MWDFQDYSKSKKIDFENALRATVLKIQTCALVHISTQVPAIGYWEYCSKLKAQSSKLSSPEIPADRMQRCWTALLRKYTSPRNWVLRVLLTASTQSQTWLLCRGCELCTETLWRKFDKISVSVEVTFQVEENFSVKNDRELSFKSEPDAKNKICGNKIGSLGAEIWACKVRTNLARVARELLARGFSRTLNSRSFSHNDRILLRHILFFPPGPDLEKWSLHILFYL